MVIEADSPDFVTSFARGLSVIRAFGQNASAMNLAEIVQKTNLSRPTARRFLLTLGALGYVRTDGKRFWLTAKTLELGYAYLSSMNIIDIVHVSLHQVVDELNESCAMAVASQSELLYVARVPPQHSMWLQVNPGTRQPLYCTSAGRVLLADFEPDQLSAYFGDVPRPKLTELTVTDENALRGILSGVRAAGYAVIDQEVEIGLRAIAVPVRDKAGKVVAGVSVGTHTGRVSMVDMIEKILPPLKACANEIEVMFAQSDRLIDF
jgi:IclR family pca regulon transcriptional regulator